MINQNTIQYIQKREYNKKEFEIQCHIMQYNTKILQYNFNTIQV